MIFWPVYLIAMLFSVYKKQWLSTVVLLIGAAVGVIHNVMMIGLKDVSTINWLALSFLLSFSWFLALDYVGAKYSTVLSVFLCLFLAAGIFDCVNFPVEDTVYFYSYPIVIAVINLMMVSLGAMERGDLHFISPGDSSLRENGKASGANPK